MKFKKGDRVCAVLVRSQWNIDFLCYVGTLEKIEIKGNANPVAAIMVDRCMLLRTKTKQAPTLTRVDVKLFRLLPWNDEVKVMVKESRKAAQAATDVIKELYAYGRT